MQKSIFKLSKIPVFLLLFFILLTGQVCAENIPQQPADLNKKDIPDYSSPEFLEKLPEELLEQRNKTKEKPEIEKCKKPDICGEIIFDPTECEVPINLEEALTISLNRNFDIKLFLARKQRDKWRFYQSFAGFLPDITSTFLLTRAQGVFIVGDIEPVKVLETPFEMNFFLNQRLSLREYFNFKESFYNFKSAREELEFSKDEALLEASRSYYNALRAKIDIEILQKNVEQIEEQFQINQQRVAAGVGTEFDVLRAEADRDNAIQRLLRRKNAYRLAQAQLANTLGVPVFIQLEPCDNDLLIRKIFYDCFNLDIARQAAFKKRDDLAAASFDIKAARQRKNAGYSIYFPEVNLIGQLAEQGTTQIGIFPAKRLTLFVEWNGLASLGLRGYTEIKARKAEIREQELLYTIRSRDIEENIVKSFSDIITARQLIDSTFLELEAAKLSREISLVRLKEGIGSFIDVILTQNVYTESRLDNIDSIIGYNIFQIELLFEMGELSINNILFGFDSPALQPNTNCDRASKLNHKIMEKLQELRNPKHSKQLHEEFYKDEAQANK